MIVKYIGFNRLTGIFILLLFAYSTSSRAQDKIPTFLGEDLNGKKVELPKDLNGKKSLVGIAISPKHQEQLETWIQPVYDELMDENSLASMVYDAEVMLVICFNKTNIKFKKRVYNELHENVLEEFYHNVILTEADAKHISDGLNINDKKIFNVYTLNKEGLVTSHTTGPYSEKKFDKLSSFLEID